MLTQAAQLQRKQQQLKPVRIVQAENWTQISKQKQLRNTKFLRVVIQVE